MPAASLILIAGCGPAGGPPVGFPPPPVSVITAETRDVPLTLEYTGQTAGYRETEVRARVSGILLSAPSGLAQRQLFDVLRVVAELAAAEHLHLVAALGQLLDLLGKHLLYCLLHYL